MLNVYVIGGINIGNVSFLSFHQNILIVDEKIEGKQLFLIQSCVFVA